MTINEIAAVCHEANRALCQAFGDNSQPLWADAPHWQTVSAIEGVKAHLLTDLGCDESHNLWMKQKTDDGWIFGKVKDDVAKTHPCIMAYDLLPPGQQAKDFVFRSIVHSLRKQVTL